MKGIDISNNNGAINFSQVKNSGVECVYIKATEGTTFQDPCKQKLYNGAKDVDLLTGFYHFLVGSSAPETQAQNFWNQIKYYENNLVPMLDVERNFSGLNDYMQRFIAEFQRISGLEIGIYSYTSFINSYINQGIFASFKLWEANYNNNPWQLPQNSFKTRIGHQYSEKGYVAGMSELCDVNVFNNGVLRGDTSTPTPVFSNKVTDNKGTDIYSELQRELNSQGFKDKNGNSLNVDGVPGELTLSACPTLRRGAYGKITQWVQLRCGAVPDQDFGYATERAVMYMQQKWGISADGIVGQNTWRHLLNLV